MKARTTKPKGIGMAAILVVALLATTGLGYAGDVQPLVAQTVDITTKDVTLYQAVDPLDNTGEIYVRYSTSESGDLNVKTGTQVVIANGQTNPWTAAPYHWEGLRYAANCLRIRIYDEDLVDDDLLYDDCHSLTTGYNLVVSGNGIVKVTTEVTVHNP
ncbi:MAG: hypothetical protein U9N36_11865 [Euryarchaeota archaeon]|nr:hypothetical protein [Euryarchaeota archaeon]